MSTTRRNFMATAGAAAGTSLLGWRSSVSAEPATVARNLIIVVAAGGWDTTYALDPKPGFDLIDAPEGEIRDFGGLDIFVNDSRPSVTAFFEAYAGIASVSRGLQVRSIVHPNCTRRVLTGTSADANPDIGAISGFEQGLDRPVPYLVLGREAYPGTLAGITASVGLTKQVKAVMSETDAYAMPPEFGMPFVPTSDDETAIRAWVEARAEREKAIRGAHGYNRSRIDDFTNSLRSGDLLRNAADDFGDRGVTLATAEQLSLATTAIESDLAWSVLVTDGQNWDTHANNASQGPAHENLFAALLAFADTLSGRPGRSAGSTMLDETVVAVVSEMSRTPKLNGDGGKDHWPTTSALVFGGGVAGGAVVGGTDDEGDGLAIDLDSGAVDAEGSYLLTGNFAAGLLEVAGVDPSSYIEELPIGAIRA